MPISDPDPDLQSTEMDASDHDLQPFFVLRKETPQKPEVEMRPRKTRRRIDSSHEKLPVDRGMEDIEYEGLRLQAFKETWSKIEGTIQDVLRMTNHSLFEDISKWISESFVQIRSIGGDRLDDITSPCPLITDAICNQIPAALIFTKNMEFVDSLLTFQELGMHLKSDGFHVASLSSLDLTAKQGVGGCIRSLLRQLSVVSSDLADISVLASWYGEEENFGKPIVVIVDDIEQCGGSVLAEFIFMLSEWVIKLPVILVLRVATTVNALQKLLPSDALQHLEPCQFSLGSPQERMDSIIEAVLVKPCSTFIVSHKVALFLRNSFSRHDGTITSFIKALKITCSKHFYIEPLSFLSHDLDEDCKLLLEKCESLPSKLLTYAYSLPSSEREAKNENTCENLVQGMLELKRSRQCWSAVLMCLLEVGKLHNVHLLDIFCDAADPVLYNHRASGHIKLSSVMTSALQDKNNYGLAKGGSIFRTINKIRDLPVSTLADLFKTWEKHTKEIFEIQNKIKDAQSLLKPTDGGTRMKQQLDTRSMSRFTSTKGKDLESVNEKAAFLMECLVRDYLKPTECFPFHEVICFKHVEILQAALIGDPRRTVQIDILQSCTYIRCSCCCKQGKGVLPSMHDTSILYTLAQEHGDLINLHDWYQSYKAIILSSSNKTKTRRKLNHSPASKKKKVPDVCSVTSNSSEAMIQARFCKAVSELQITGLLRMPSKRRPDYVQRLVFSM